MRLFKVKIPHIICLFVMVLGATSLVAANAGDVQQFNRGMENFGTRLFVELAQQNRHKNIIFSPFSIQTCLTMARMGAEGQTADELDQTLALSAQKAEDLANHYHAILAKYENSNILTMANKIYAMTGYSVQDTFNQLLTEQFYSKVDSINFANNGEAAHTINSWVEQKTNNLIKDLINPTMLDAATRLVLVNAIHFKGNWVHPFAEHATREADFYLDDTNTIKVQMMFVKNNFKYAELDDLDAKVLEMPYKDSDLSMLVILPNTRTGLVELENKLKNTSLAEITEQMSSTKVVVNMPKFKAEFKAELSEPLSKMGMKRMFSSNAEFGKMLKSGEGLKVSSVIHKAFIEVNESGTEAAAATGALVRAKRAVADLSEIKDFNIEQPFLFKILHKHLAETSTPASSLILFAAKIENLDQNKTNFNEIKDEL